MKLPKFVLPLAGRKRKRIMRTRLVDGRTALVLVSGHVVDQFRHEIPKYGKYELTYLLLGKRHGKTVAVRAYIPIPNIHEDPKHAFRIDLHKVPEEYRRDAVGILHTHPRGEGRGPSMEDVEGMKDADGMIGIVVHQPSRRATYFNGDGVIAKSNWK